MGLEISKCYSYSFHPISAKRYDTGYHGGIQATVNSLMFARDLFGDFHDHIKSSKIYTCIHNSGT